MAVLVAALAGVSWLAAGCGGASPGAGVASVASPTTTTGTTSTGGSKSASPAAFSACMRSHGVPNFPDPDSKGRTLIRGGRHGGLDPNSPTFKAAQQACRKLLPNGGNVSPQQQAKALRAALKFSACMRSHGVPNFPDPKVSGGAIGLTFGKNAGVDPNSSEFNAAQKSCQHFLPGGPTSGGRKGAP